MRLMALHRGLPLDKTVHPGCQIFLPSETVHCCDNWKTTKARGLTFILKRHLGRGIWMIPNIILQYMYLTKGRNGALSEKPIEGDKGCVAVGGSFNERFHLAPPVNNSEECLLKCESDSYSYAALSQSVNKKQLCYCGNEIPHLAEDTNCAEQCQNWPSICGKTGYARVITTAGDSWGVHVSENLLIWFEAQTFCEGVEATFRHRSVQLSASITDLLSDHKYINTADEYWTQSSAFQFNPTELGTESPTLAIGISVAALIVVLTGLVVVVALYIHRNRQNRPTPKPTGKTNQTENVYDEITEMDSIHMNRLDRCSLIWLTSLGLGTRCLCTILYEAVRLTNKMLFTKMPCVFRK
ncbi:hypothetical protein CAPTEDRAFT_206239 [Capitella teleta]|uniref:WSC domain-containing protein n=1 Tax=Capitella teleta TaxID=283909 RepID=R7UEQ3_CAPTE|nr:hypothetical protein CAPTEDRAFT_206239 [Capitella teleta]|eukprot:ELU05014.1 hypothetical protein CAPTEDRAFT_206239 [Capitella teleta]